MPRRKRSRRAAASSSAYFLTPRHICRRSFSLLAVLVGLYEEPDKPSQAIEFIKMQLGAPGSTDVDALKSENESLKEKVDSLTKELEDAKAKLAEVAPPE